MSGERGRRVRVRAPGRGEPAHHRRARRFVHPVHHDEGRTRGGVHGRHVRRPHRRCRRVPGDPRSRRDQPDARDRERAARLAPARGHHRAGRVGPDLQGVAPVRRPGLAVPAHHQVGRHGHACGGGAGDDPQGVQAGDDRTAGRDVRDPSRGRRRASGRGRAAAGERSSRPGAVRGPGAPGGPRPADGDASGRAGRSGRGARWRGRCVDPLLRAIERAGRHHVPRQGRVPRRPPERPRDDRLHGQGLRQLRVRSRRRGRGRGVRPRGVLAGALEPEP